MVDVRQDDCGTTWVNLEASRPLSSNDKKGPGLTPGDFVESCIAAMLEFQYIFDEQKQTLPSPQTKVWGITPGEIFEFCIVVGENLENEN